MLTDSTPVTVNYDDDADIDEAMEDAGNTDTPLDTAEPSSFEKQKASLQTYVDSLPYPAESVEDMLKVLEGIVGKIYICAQTRNFNILCTWDGLLQNWLSLKYPMPTTTRARLTRLYYELTILPGIETRTTRSWADIITRLTNAKPGQKRKLESSDLTLEWQPLWRVLKKELFPKDRLRDPTRNLHNVLLYMAEHCSHYFPPSEIPEMLNTFLPLLTQETFLIMIPVLTSFIPTTHAQLYMPAFFKLWEAFHSGVIEDRMIERCGILSENNLAIERAEGNSPWKDVGIWTTQEWNFLIGRGSGYMNVPIGSSKGSTGSISQYADSARMGPIKLKKTVDRYEALAKIIIYSISVDSPVSEDSTSLGIAAGSKALDSLKRLITSVESFFHPSNAGPWTVILTSFLNRLASEFYARCKKEETNPSKIPVTRRITAGIRHEFVSILTQPALLAMFSKDSMSVMCVANAVRLMSMLEPAIIMPELLERAQGGLEVVNETHRTTAVLNILQGLAMPLVNEKIWLGGQKHILPLLELCLPGIDLNDPNKTIHATSFIMAIVQHIKIGDLTQSGHAFTDDAEDQMDTDTISMPSGVEGGMPALSRAEERTLVRESTSGFADWVTTLFRRVLALYENLPEEGGKRNTTGGKQEETVLKNIKNMLDHVCLALSDPLFDLVLKLVFEYATTNAKSNSVRVFGIHLIAALSRANAEKVLAKFMPYCVRRIKEELSHGASSLRTTSSNSAAVASDTSLHWNMGILRGAFTHGGPALLKHKADILEILSLLVDKTKNERGYTSTTRMISRVLTTLATLYPTSNRFVDESEWDTPEFNLTHNLHWGRLTKPEDTKIQWHRPSEEELSFALDIQQQVLLPALQHVEALVPRASTWSPEDRNDFCRYLQAARTATSMANVSQDRAERFMSPVWDYEIEELVIRPLLVNAGFVLSNPANPQYQALETYSQRFGAVCRDSASALRKSSGGEDHLDAVMATSRAIDAFMMDYGRSGLDNVEKSYTRSRDAIRLWAGQKEFSRLVLVRRAQFYHSTRVHMHSLYRRRTPLDDELLTELVELSLSPYTRVRVHAQSVLRNATGHFARSTRFCIPLLYAALEKGSDADRIKGALYVLWDKGIAAYAIGDPEFQRQYLVSLLACQREQKPSIQKLVGQLIQDSLGIFQEEDVHTDCYTLPCSRVDAALKDVSLEFSANLVDRQLLAETQKMKPRRELARRTSYSDTVSSVLDIARNNQTHWRYVEMSIKILSTLLRRDDNPSPEMVTFLSGLSISPQPTIQGVALRALSKLLAFVKIRSYSNSADQLWRSEWRNPLAVDVPVGDPANFVQGRKEPLTEQSLYFDHLRTGFIAWSDTVQGYSQPPKSGTTLKWENASQSMLDALQGAVVEESYFGLLIGQWSQESTKESSSLDLIADNVTYIKSLAKTFGFETVSGLLGLIEPLLFDPAKFKQRCGGEVLAGLIRGSKHWSKASTDKLWTWLIPRLNQVLLQITPETLSFWDNVFLYMLDVRDLRRNQPLVDWITSLPLDFAGDSAFQMRKNLVLINGLIESTSFDVGLDRYAELVFENANTSYAEIRLLMTKMLSTITTAQWRPAYKNAQDFLEACKVLDDPLKQQEARYSTQVSTILNRLPGLKEDRLAPPRVSQSEYDKTALSLLLLLWLSVHDSSSPIMFPYIVSMLPEILRMTELNDNPELQSYSSGVLYIISSIPPSSAYISVILNIFVDAIKKSASWRLRLHALPTLVVFFYRNLLAITSEDTSKVMDVLLLCLSDENIEVREMASKTLSSVVRCSQRHSILPLKNRFVSLVRRTTLPPRRDPQYATQLRKLHSGILGLCALIETFPYSVEPWMPPLTDVLASHAADPAPISTAIRKCASEFKKTHQDTWHKDEMSFNADELQNLSLMIAGTSYYA